jgi:hypothetical protein
MSNEIVLTDATSSGVGVPRRLYAYDKVMRAIGLEALFQIYSRSAFAQGIIIDRRRFLQMPIPMVVNAEILLDNWRHVRGLAVDGRVGTPQLPTPREFRTN